MPDVGDFRTPSLTVSPFDATTLATLEIEAPDGTKTPLAVTTGDGGNTWTATGSYELTAAGEWIERWTVTGTGKGQQRNAVLVAPDPATVPAGLRVYATTTDYATLLRKAPPADSRRALAEASRVVDEMLLTTCYDVDDDGKPTDPDVIAALRDATVLQADFAANFGDKNLVGARKPAGFSLGKLSIQQPAQSGGSGAGGLGPRGEWSPRAFARLREAGLTGGGPSAPETSQ